MYYIKKIVPIVLITIFYSCSSSKPKATIQLSKNSKKMNTRPSEIKKNIYPSSQKANVQKDNKLKNWQKVDFDKLESDYFSNSVKTDTNKNKIEISQNKIKNLETLPEKVSTKTKIETIPQLNTNLKNGYSNSLRVKTVYEIATETQPNLFLPHDEFETAREYKTRVTEQVKLMKEIVLMTSQKMDIRNAQRIKIAKEKELKKVSLIQSLMAESSSNLEFSPNDIGRYNPEKETFPVVLHDVQYQISVPREEARTFKENFELIKIRGIKQLKPRYDISITAKKAHIRSRPNGSIIGIASNGDIFEHVQDEDEWHKINFKGQFGFTHQNNADLKLVDIANEYEYLDLVAIHPTTGSLFTMISVDELVKAPLNLASRKISESGLVDGP
ncbi:hypothetical protein OAN38_04600 [Candidatus Marinimicrobia bacterium]|jgi:hypothetical protein|nr:hypothetical protein [Candidatus Neomarinimicrobiota bacterium]MDA8752926.1 hypothetical protein [Candidatus Neomarinimicrobiota bacterium]MDC0384104.1 hypothetical protein [Candidatus Neomarinimicrobiota bacterium]